MATERYFRDAATRFQVYLERYKTGAVRDSDKVLAELDRTIRRVLATVSGTPLNQLSKKRFEKLLEDVVLAMDKPISRYRSELTAALRELNEYTAGFEKDLLNTATKASVAVASAGTAAAWAVALEEPIQATGELLEPFMKSWGDRTKHKIVGALRNGYAQGKSVDEIVREIRGTKANQYKDGLIGGTIRRETAAMVRTAMQHASHTAREAVWQANDDLVEKYRWVSTLDGRTTAQCRSLDGREFEIGKGPQPPIHIACRSTTIAVIPGVSLLDKITRASKGAEGGAPVAGDMTYYEWLKTQPAWFQDDAIGATRAKLLRDGGLSAAEFSRLNLDKNFQPLTLEEMRRKAPRAFALADID